jgi:hypothetical protein
MQESLDEDLGLEYYDVELEDGSFVSGPYFYHDSAEDYINEAYSTDVEEAIRYRVGGPYYL